MKPPRRLGILCLLGASLVSGACAGRYGRLPREGADRAQVGVYRARLAEGAPRARRFKLLLFVAPPDRLHGEILTPVGATATILDGGGGRLAVTFVRDRVSYVGEADPEIIERVLGVRASLDQLVAGLLTGEQPPDGWTVQRSAGGLGGLPERVEFRSAETSLTLDRTALRSLARPVAALGTGEPPPHTERRPLGEIVTRLEIEDRAVEDEAR